MNLKSLFLGSVAAATLTTGAFAADLGVLTSLDVCDQLGLSGLTISSDTNCLQITGAVDYRFRFGNFAAGTTIATMYDDTFDLITPDAAGAADLDYQTRARAFLRVVGTANTDFGPASAIIRLRTIDETRFRNEGFTATGQGDDTGGPIIDEAYVRIGDTTVLMAGKRLSGVGGSIARIDDDESLTNFSFMSDPIEGGGILIDADDRRLGNHVIQAVTDLGNGFDAGIALENIDGRTGSGATFVGSGNNGAAAGTLVGVLGYKGETVSAHVTGIAYGVLDGTVEAYAVHAGATGTFENFQVRAAIAYDSNFKPYFNLPAGVVGNALDGLADFSVLHGILTGKATFDIFTVAAAGQFATHDADRNGVYDTDYELSGQIGATVTDGVTLNLSGTYFRDDSADLDTVRVQGDAAFAVSETITLTAALGVDFGSGVEAGTPGVDGEVIFGGVGATWKPGGDLESSILVEANDIGAYRTTVSAQKSFQ